jgi:BNR repeat-like domain
MRSRSFLAGSALLASVLLLTSTPSAAVAGAGPHQGRPYKVKDLRVVSGPSPFAGGCPGARFDDQAITGHELEPAVTVNPANPRNIVAAWKQDVGSANQSRSDLVASSLDGGKTWKRRTIPGLTACTGGTADAGSDPWVAAGGDGTVYFSGLGADISTDPPTTAVVASRSRDGGRTWRPPATVARPLQGNETDAITASPRLAGHAYLVWANFVFGLPRTNTVEFSRTTDGGRTWSSPVLVDQLGPSAIDQAPRLLVLPDGTLLAVFARADFDLGLAQLYAARSLDEGRTWLPPVLAGSKPLPPDIVDPETGIPLPQPGFPGAAVAPNGTVYIAVEDNTSASSGGIAVARSRDGGRTWTSATLPGVTAFAFEPAIAVDAHGTVGVTWYDLRNDRPGDAALSADVWFAHSQDRGRSWRQAHVAGPTDLHTAPLPAHNYVGEYQGLAGLPRGRGFAAAFTLAAPQAKDGPTDIFFARIGPGR